MGISAGSGTTKIQTQADLEVATCCGAHKRAACNMRLDGIISGKPRLCPKGPRSPGSLVQRTSHGEDVAESRQGELGGMTIVRYIICQQVS